MFSKAGDIVLQIVMNGKPHTEKLFPNMGISNPTTLELILHAVTVFTYWNFDSLQKRGEGPRSEANMG